MKRIALLFIVMTVGVSDASAKVVSTETGFHKAVSQMGGGVIVLRAGSYGTLVVSSREGRWLTIRARPGVRVRNLVLRNVRRVRVVDVRVKYGRLNVHSSSQVKLERVRLVHSRMSLTAANFVTINRSQFTRCGENREACLATGWGQWASSHVRIIGTRFFDCYGCDFVRGHIGGSLIIRGSRFDRAVPGPCGTTWECNHNDAVQISGGRGILIENNRFGLAYQGAGQLYMSGDIDGLTIRNNIFLGTDAAFPSLAGWAGIVVGHHGTDRDLPSGVVITHNTVLTGSLRPDGITNSVFMTPRYLDVPIEERPVMANNVLGMTGTPERLCALLGVSVRNITREGTACSDSDAVLDPMLDDLGHPLEGSPVVDQADPLWTHTTDLRGWARDATPDIGAFELVR